MASSSVLLSREVLFEYDPEKFDGASEGGGESTDVASGSRSVPSRQGRKDAVASYLKILEPDACFVNPPLLSSFRILQPTDSRPPFCADIDSGFIASADKNLVALYAGPYRPGTYLEGGYLIYDCKKKSLSAIPPPPYDSSRADVGIGAVVLRLTNGGEGAYVLGELTLIQDSSPPQAALLMWQSCTATWVVKTGSFPHQMCPPNHVFMADMCFSYGDFSLCWVDLFQGIVICDLFPVLQQGRSHLKFCFIPLPHGCPTYARGLRYQWPLEGEEFRSMACVGGFIKFVTMDGYGEKDCSDVSLTTWTLLSNLRTWRRDKMYYVRNIWASQTHKLKGLPKILPSYPVLSMHEPDVVYLVFTDFKQGEDQLEYHGQYLLRVDMLRKTVRHHPSTTEQICAQPFASDCSAYCS